MSYQNQDLPYFSLYGLKVRMMGYPRMVEHLETSTSGRYELVQDTTTGAKFICPLTHISAGIKPGVCIPADIKDRETYGFKNV